MLSSREPKKSLSKNLLQMKFMQKRREEFMKEEQEKEYKVKLSEEHWFVETPLAEELSAAIESESSFVLCEDLLPMGRMSFKNFNPAVEKLYSDALRKQDMGVKGIKDDEEDVSEEEMAKRYDSLIDSVGKKFTRKRKSKREPDNNNSDEEKAVGRKAKKQKNAFAKPKYD